MNILLIAPKYRNTYGEYYEFPLGLACISAVLKQANFNVFCLNLNHCQDVTLAVQDAIKNYNIKIVGTGGLSAHFHTIDSILKIVKACDSSILTILGGGIISSEPELIYESLMVDYGVLQEGEETIVELVYTLIHNKDVSNIQSIVYSKNGKTIVTPIRKSIEDLDKLPFPDYEGFGVNEYLAMQRPNDNYYLYPFDNPRTLPVISTRSCPFSCTFCYHPLGKTYRVNSLDYFFKWVDFLVQNYQINMLLILDELFSVNKARMLEFAVRIKPYNLKWIAQMRVDDVDEEILAQLKDSGLFYISYGIESASDKILKSMKKKIKLEKIEKALTLTKKYGIGIQGNLIFGDVEENEETYQESLLWWEKNKAYQINLGLIEPYPGTPLYIQASKIGIIKDKLEFIKQGCPPLNLTRMKDDAYQKMTQIIWKEFSQNKIYATEYASHLTHVDPIKGNMYHVTITCPHCNSKIQYKNMHRTTNNLFKLGCKNCNQRFDLSIYDIFKEDFPEIGYIVGRLRDIIEKKQVLAIIPCIPEFKISDLLQELLKDDWKKLNIQYCFDNDKAKLGKPYLNQHITDYTLVDFKKLSKNIVFLIPPTMSKQTSRNVKEFLLNNDIDENNILLMAN